MAGDKVLFVEDSAAIQDLAKNVLEKANFEVITASNGIAALTCEDLVDVDVIVIDSDLRDMDGFETVERLREESDLFRTPILLLVPDEKIHSETSLYLKGANAFLIKPFEPKVLVATVKDLLQEQEIFSRSQQHVRDAAEKFIGQLAEEEIKNAVERRKELIIERVIQNVVTAVEQRTRKEVDTQVTSLVSEKEQELVRLTVSEVAHSMVEKLADRKVTEAMESILDKETERVVKRAADIALPNIIREKVKDGIEYALPREVEMKVKSAADQLVPEVSGKIVSMIENVAERVVPKVARERLDELITGQSKQYCDKNVPNLVNATLSKEFRIMCDRELSVLVRQAAKKIWTKVIIINSVISAVVIALVIAGYFILSNNG